jgi:hypothetical protein
VRDWIDFYCCLSEGPLFRAINRFGKLSSRLRLRAWPCSSSARALVAGLASRQFAGHCLRSGLATDAAKAGKSERSIMKQTGRRSVSVVRRYIRDAELFDDTLPPASASDVGALGKELPVHAPRRH